MAEMLLFIFFNILHQWASGVGMWGLPKKPLEKHNKLTGHAPRHVIPMESHGPASPTMWPSSCHMAPPPCDPGVTWPHLPIHMTPMASHGPAPPGVMWPPIVMWPRPASHMALPLRFPDVSLEEAFGTPMAAGVPGHGRFYLGEILCNSEFQ